MGLYQRNKEPLHRVQIVIYAANATRYIGDIIEETIGKTRNPVTILADPQVNPVLTLSGNDLVPVSRTLGALIYILDQRGYERGIHYRYK